MENVIFEFIKEFRVSVPGMVEQVKARIWREIREDSADIYTYDFSHHYLPGEGAIEYAPEYMGRQSLEQAEIITLKHLRLFTVAHGIPEKNKHFRDL